MLNKPLIESIAKYVWAKAKINTIVLNDIKQFKARYRIY